MTPRASKKPSRAKSSRSSEANKDEKVRTRRRRNPEEAREAILVAADRLFAAEGPETVGLAMIAREVGVTHGLVTHYFGTFANLVREVFARRNRLAAAALLEQIVGARERGGETLARFAIDFVSDEVRARLLLWLRFNDPGGGGGQGAQLLRVLIDALERELPTLLPDQPLPSRAQIEDIVLLTLAAGHGYAIGKRPWLRGLGREDDAAADEAFRRLLERAVRRLAQPEAS